MDREQQELSDEAPPTPESEPDLLRSSHDQANVIVAELLLEGRQVAGEIRSAGVTRRLVDILNLLDGGYLAMHKGTIRDRSGNCLEFDLIQLPRRSILLAFPHEGSPSRIDPGEIIEKQRRLVTVIMPGCQVSGYVHVALGIDPSVATAVNRFVALTDATITAIDNNIPTRFESVALLNTAHAQAYVWSDEAASPTARSAHTEALPINKRTESVDSQLY